MHGSWGLFQAAKTPRVSAKLLHLTDQYYVLNMQTAANANNTFKQTKQDLKITDTFSNYPKTSLQLPLATLATLNKIL